MDMLLREADPFALAAMDLWQTEKRSRFQRPISCPILPHPVLWGTKRHSSHSQNIPVAKQRSRATVGSRVSGPAP